MFCNYSLHVLVAHGLTSSSILIQIDTDSLKPFFCSDWFVPRVRPEAYWCWQMKKKGCFHSWHVVSLTHTKKLFCCENCEASMVKALGNFDKAYRHYTPPLKGKLAAYNNWRALENWSNLFSLERENCHSMRRAARAIHFKKVYCCVILVGIMCGCHYKPSTMYLRLKHSSFLIVCLSKSWIYR